MAAHRCDADPFSRVYIQSRTSWKARYDVSAVPMRIALHRFVSTAGLAAVILLVAVMTMCGGPMVSPVSLCATTRLSRWGCPTMTKSRRRLAHKAAQRISAFRDDAERQDRARADSPPRTLFTGPSTSLLATPLRA